MNRTVEICSNERDRFQAIERAARAYIMSSWGTLDVDMINASRARNGDDPVNAVEAALMRALQ